MHVHAMIQDSVVTTLSSNAPETGFPHHALFLEVQSLCGYQKQLPAMRCGPKIIKSNH